MQKKQKKQEGGKNVFTPLCVCVCMYIYIYFFIIIFFLSFLLSEVN